MKNIEIKVTIRGGVGHIIITRHGEQDITISRSGVYPMEYPVFGNVLVYGVPPHEGSIEIDFSYDGQSLAHYKFEKPESRSFTLILPES